jgi:hypothetical protein
MTTHKRFVNSATGADRIYIIERAAFSKKGHHMKDLWIHPHLPSAQPDVTLGLWIPSPSTISPLKWYHSFHLWIPSPSTISPLKWYVTFYFWIPSPSTISPIKWCLRFHLWIPSPSTISQFKWYLSFHLRFQRIQHCDFRILCHGQIVF